MSVQPPQAVVSGADLETTAELPVLEISAEAAAEEALADHGDSLLAPPLAPAAPEGSAVSALAANLRDAEERLRSKDARVIELEREIAELREELGAVARRGAAPEPATAASRPTVVRERDLESSLVYLQRELSLARALATEHLERLQTREMRRVIREDVFRALDHDIGTRDARLAAVEFDLARRQNETGHLQAELDARAERIQALEREIAAQSATLAERSEELRASGEARERQEAAYREAEERIGAQAESIRILQRDLQSATERAQELESDLRAAEDAINRLEAEVRARSSRTEELVRIGEERRAAEMARTQRAEVDLTGAETASSLQHTMVLPDPSSLEPPDGATRLLVRSGSDAEVVHVLGRKTTVGRTPDNDLQIDARFISRHHAVILAGPVQTVIEDLNSTNGVRVNGRRVTRQLLKDGDVVIIGKTRFRFALRQSPRS